MSIRTPCTASSRHARISRTASSTTRSSSRSTPSSFGRRVKNLYNALCATEPRNFASTSASIVRGERKRSTNHADEQSAKRSSSVTLNVVREPSCSRTSGCVIRVGRSNAPSARSSRRSHAFARASAPAAGSSSAARRASARSRSRSVGASSSVHVSADSLRCRVQRRTSSVSNAACTSSQNGLASRGVPSSEAASRTR